MSTEDFRTSKEQCREQFDMWAENLGLCMDELFMSSTGVPENSFEDQDTKSFYMAWLAAWEACEALRSAPEPPADQAEIVTIQVIGGKIVGHIMKAPGLPDGFHDLFCESVSAVKPRVEYRCEQHSYAGQDECPLCSSQPPSPDLLERMRSVYKRVQLYPESTPEGTMDLLVLRGLVGELLDGKATCSASTKGGSHE